MANLDFVNQMMKIKEFENKMMRQRGFTHCFYPSDSLGILPPNDTLLYRRMDFFLNREPASRLDFSCVYFKVSDEEKLEESIKDGTLVLYLGANNSHKKTGKQETSIFDDALKFNLESHINVYSKYIIITQRGLTSQAMATLRNYEIDITFFIDNDFMENIFSKAFNPLSYKVWSKDEHHIFEKEEEITISMLPTISVNDAYIKKLGLEIGSIIMTEVLIPGGDLGTRVDYRLIVV